MPQLLAGIAAAPLEPPLGAPMMGYGARVGTAEGVHDPLQVRALYLEAGSSLLWVECDLCLVAPAQADAVRARLAERTGVPAERILLGCIHTHSGPDTGFGALLGGGAPDAWLAGLWDRVVEAGARACEAAAPARLGVGRAEASIGRNRRSESGPLDPGVLVLRVDRADRTPLAVVYIHGCHPTALGHDNLRYSADWPAAANATIEARLPGAMALFALGAHADVDPRTRGLLDLAIADQSVGVSYEQTVALGRELGDAVADVAEGIATDPETRVAAGSARIALLAHAPSDEGRAAALRALNLPADGRYRTAELFALEQERTRDLPEAERRERIAAVRRYLRDRTARHFAFSTEPDVEVQVLRIGDVALLGLPLEPTVDVGLEWRERAPAPDAAVLGIANGWMRYLPHPRNFEEPDAHQKYEVLQSTFAPDAALRLIDRAEALARELSQ